jgi:hypothetical protein
MREFENKGENSNKDARPDISTQWKRIQWEEYNGSSDCHIRFVSVELA